MISRLFKPYYLLGLIATLSCSNHRSHTDNEFKYYENETANLESALVNLGDSLQYIEFDKYGYKFSEGTFRNEKREGKFTYFQNGKVQRIESFKDGLLDGKYIIYDMNCCGYPLKEGVLAKNKKEGLWCEYYRGVLILAELYKGDSLIKIVYKNSKIDPSSTNFDEDSVECSCDKVYYDK